MSWGYYNRFIVEDLTNISNRKITMTDISLVSSFEKANCNLYGDMDKFFIYHDDHVYINDDEIKRIIRLISYLNTYEKELSIPNLLANTRYIYDYYKYKVTQQEYNNEINMNEDEDDNIIFTACIYLSLSIWYNYDPCNKFKRILDSLYSRRIFDNNTIKSYIIRIFTTLDGYIIFPTVFKGNETKGEEEEARRVSYRDIIMTYFTTYKYMSFIAPSLIGKAITIIHNDICIKLDRKEDVMLLENDFKNDINHKNVMLLCGIIVKHFKYIIKYVHTNVPEISQLFKSIVTLDYNNNTKQNISKRRKLSSTKTVTTMKKNETNQFQHKKENIIVLSSSSSTINLNNKKDTIDNSKYVCILTYNDKMDSKVYCGIDRSRVPHQKYTIKRFTYNNKKEENDHNIGDEEELIHDICYIIREIATIRYLQSFNRDDYNKLIGTISKIGFDSQYLYMYMKPNAISLSSFIKTTLRQNSNKNNNDIMKSLMHSMCKSIAICHRHNIVHGDIKPENFIIEDDHLKLIDFGLSECHFSYISSHTDSIQTIEYRAPELLLGCRNCDESIDIWALGCSIYEVLTYGKEGRLFAVKQPDYEKCDFDEPTIESRSTLLKIISYRLAIPILDIGSLYPNICTYPLWHRFKTETNNPPHNNFILKSVYNPINWSTSIKKEHAEYANIVSECVNFVPTDRPTAMSLTNRVVTHCK